MDRDDAPVSPPATGVILLSRALCRFAFVPRAAALSQKEAEDAALLYAEAHTPFANSGRIVVKSPAGFGVWWWDASLVASLVEGKTPFRANRFIPESLGYSGPGSMSAKGAAKGWRQVRSADGYEAQYIEDDVLRASSWRRNPFDAPQWRGFTKAVPAPSEPPPLDPPAPCSPGWPVGQPWLSSLVVRTPVWRRVERFGWATAATGVAVATVLMGHAARYNAIADTHLAAVAAMRSDKTASRVENRTAADIDLATAAAAAAPLPEHLIAVADVMAAMADAGIEPSSWESSADAVSVSGVGAPAIEEIASRLERNPRLRNVEPFRLGEQTVIRAEMEPYRGALSDGAP